MANKNNKNRYTLYIDCDYVATGGEIYKGQENDDWPSFEDEYRSYTYEFVTFNKEHFKTLYSLYRNYEFFDVQNEQEYEKLRQCSELYLSIVVYDDSDTFSTRLGVHDIIGVSATFSEAEKINDNYNEAESYFHRITDKIIVCVPLKP